MQVSVKFEKNTVEANHNKIDSKIKTEGKELLKLKLQSSPCEGTRSPVKDKMSP